MNKTKQTKNRETEQIQKKGIYKDFEIDPRILKAAEMYSKLKEVYGDELIDKLIETLDNDVYIPVSIFKDMNCIEAIVKYLKDEEIEEIIEGKEVKRRMTEKEIALRLGKDIKTIKEAYKNAKNKILIIYKDEMNEITIPLSTFTNKIFTNEKLTMLESLIKYLKEAEGLKYNIIARILGRNQRTIWTLYNRTIKKLINK